MKGLSDFEQAVLDKLLAGDHPVLTTLRAQAESAHLQSREHTGVGFFCTFDVSPAAPVLATHLDFKMGDVTADIGGLQHCAGFILFIRGGRLDMLEGFSYDEPWPMQIESYSLTYAIEPRELPLS